MAQLVTDPSILAKLNSSETKEVTDPSILAKLNGEETKSEPTDPVRGAYRGVANTLYQGINDVGAGVGKAVDYVTPDSVKNAVSKGIDYYKDKNSVTSPLYHAVSDVGIPLAKKEIEDLESYDTATNNLKSDFSAFGKNAKAFANLPIVKPIAELGELGGLKALGKGRDIVNNVSDKMATKVPIDKNNADIIKMLTKAGHSPEEIVEGYKLAKEEGMTIGEAFRHPKILGIERKIAGMSTPAGKKVRDFVKDRVDPNNNVSMPYKLKNIADPLVKAVDEASKDIGKITENAPKVPMEMTSVESSLSKEARPPKSPVTNTLGRIDALFDWAKSQGGTFADWHRVKQEISNLKNEAKDPTSVEKLDSKTVNKYYKKVNDVLGGKTAGLPKELQETARNYKAANEKFAKNISGRTIEDVLSKAPTGGNPSSKLKYLYKQLAESTELQDELFAGMPESQRLGMLKLLQAINDSGRSGVSDMVKSMEEGTPSFPTSWRGTIGVMKDKVLNAITRKDYDGLAKSLTDPNVEAIAKRLGFVKMAEPVKPMLKLTYQPKAPDISVNREGQGKLLSRMEQAETDRARDRLESLGIHTDHFKIQDMKTVQELEKKYGQSELGKFVIANRNTPFIDKAWEIPQKEYSQATVDKMMRDSAWDKITEEQREKISSEIEHGWNSHQVTLADMILSARQAARELSEIKGIPDKMGNVGSALLDAVNGKR